MKLVVDANVLFSAAIRDSKTSDLLLNDDLELYAPEYLFDEFKKYQETLLEKTYRTDEDFENFLEILQSRIKTVSKEKFENELVEAKTFTPDPKDVPYLALALHIDASVWSDDTDFQEQDRVNVFTTTELVEKLVLK